MHITDDYVYFGPSYFKRSEVNGFKYEEDRELLFIHLSAYSKWFELGSVSKPWPFELESFRHEDAFYLPEHIVGYKQENRGPLLIWTKTGEIEVPVDEPESYLTQRRLSAGNTPHSKWLTVCKSAVGITGQ